MAKGLYFYKLHSVYDEDVTKNCKLTIDEIDSNFITLKDADIKDFAYEESEKRLVLTRNDSKAPKLYADLSPIVDAMVTDFSVEYDKCQGILKISYNGKTVVVDGLFKPTDAMNHVDSDSTLVGLGTAKFPLGLNIMEKTGLYKPCLSFIDMVNGEKLPNLECVQKGDRYITREKVSDYGYLYNFKGVEAISRDLHCGWRIPTKEDWDGVLNAVEPCDYDRNHGSLLCNKELGKLAGKLLKSSYEWYGDQDLGSCGCQSEQGCGCINDEIFGEIEDNQHHFKKEECFEHHPKRKPIAPNGVDAFGMHILGAGYSDGCEVNDYFGKRGIYWTSSKMDNTDIYVKRFDFNKAGVIQAAVSPQDFFSLRLVKDYDGSNFNDVEFINGHMCTCVLMPSLTAKSGYSIWTSNNIGFDECYYNPKKVEGVECAYTIRYFTAEWNGLTWVKKLLNEGEGAVLFTGLDEDEYQEYRLVKGELISVSSSVYESIYKEVEKLIEYIKELIEQNTKDIEDIKEEIEDIKEEIEDVESKVDEVSGKTEEIEDTIENVILPSIDSISGAVETEIDRATRRENEIYDRLISEGNYDSTTGVLTLVAENPENNITVQFNGDYGLL